MGMPCRAGCGACCIAPSITTSMPGMPNGKPAGQRCLNLSEDNACRLFGQPGRPDFCTGLSASPDMCGASFREAMTHLSMLEIKTKPAAGCVDHG